MKTIKDIRFSTEMSRAEFARVLGIPLRTVQNWELGINQCPDYLIKLIDYYITNEYQKRDRN